MFNPFKWLDGILLRAAQWFCDKVQRLTGLTKFKLQKWAIILGTSLFGLNAAMIQEYASFYIVALILSSLVTVGIVYYAEEDESEFIESGKLLPDPLYDSTERLGFLAIFSSGILGYLLSGDVFKFAAYSCMLYICWVYITACVPRPPSKCKARELYEKTLTWINNKLQPAPVPTPN